MKLEIEVKFNVGDTVKILKKKPGDIYNTTTAIEFGIVSGYVIHYSDKARVYYTLNTVNGSNGHTATGHKARYNAKDLELIKKAEEK